MNLKQKYGGIALVAGASEGLGAAFATYIAGAGMDLVLVARRKEPLELLAAQLRAAYQVSVSCICCDLAATDAAVQIQQAIQGKEVGLLIYNAALSYIGPFENNTAAQHLLIAQANMVTPLHLLHILSAPMLEKGRGAVVMMASLAGFQGSGFLSVYGATKAYNRVLAEGLWYEWKERGVDVIACCAGATATPNFIATKPEKASFLRPVFKCQKKWWRNVFSN